MAADDYLGNLRCRAKVFKNVYDLSEVPEAKVLHTEEQVPVVEALKQRFSQYDSAAMTRICAR